MNRTFSILLMVGGLTVASSPWAGAATTQTLRAAAENNAGVEALKRNELDAAIARLRSARALEPGNDTILHNLVGALDARAKKASDAARPDDAERDYADALALDPNEAKVIAHFAAFLNNRAVGFMRERRSDQARRYFERAESYLPRVTDPALRDQIRANRSDFLTAEGNAPAETQHPEQARAPYKETLAGNASDADALASLADLDYDADQYAAALQGYEKALAAAVAPDHAELRATLQQRMDTLRKEMAIETGFMTIRDRLGRFEATFPKDLPKGTVANVLQTLNEVYAKVGRDFDFYPNHPVRVKIYTRAQINAIQQIPPWVTGFFDGKLRLLDDRLSGGPAAVRGTIAHEYTHAIIYFVAGDTVPSWLHEGLAQLEDPAKQVTERDLRYLAPRARSGTLATLDEMAQPFDRNESGNRMLLIYLQSRAFVNFIVERYGWEKIRLLLREARRARKFDAAFSATYGMSPAEMEKQWQQRLKAEG